MSKVPTFLQRHGFGQRLRESPALHLADQALSSGTNFLATVVVARLATPKQFGVFSVVLAVYYVTAGFNRWVPHAIAMTMEWDDERARNGLFFLPAFVLGIVGGLALFPILLFLDPSFAWLALLLPPLLVQDALRMHSFAVHKPHLAFVSDAVWLTLEVVGLLLATTAGAAAAVWAMGGVCGAFVARPWLHLRWQRPPIGASAFSSSVEYLTLVGTGYLTPLLAGPIVGVRGVGALQGANLIRGPIVLLVQGLVVHRMAGDRIPAHRSTREALRLSITTFSVTVLCAPWVVVLRDLYGPRLLGSTWPGVRPLVVPAVLTLLMGSIPIGPATVVRKMGRFQFSAQIQGLLAPLFLGLAITGAAVSGPEGLLYGTSAAFGASALLWWVVLPKAGEPRARRDQ